MAIPNSSGPTSTESMYTSHPVNRTIVLVLDHPPLEGIPIRVDPSDPVHVASMQVITKTVPPSR